MNRIVAFDVETPNKRNDRICSLGVTLIENGEIIDSFYYLINPACEFDHFNVSLHGIKPEDVAFAPTFDIVWEEIGGLFRENLVAAHNATFDLCVLKKVLAQYNIAETIINYVCTMRISMAENYGISNYKLSTLCDYFGIQLKHHNAASDSNACAAIICNYVKAGVDLKQYTNAYNLSCKDYAGTTAYSRISASSQALLQLNGILEGVTCDNLLTEEEVAYLENWMEKNSSLRGNYPYDNIFNIISNALQDGVLEKNELDEMLELFKKLYDPLSNCNCDCSNISLDGKNVCLSGEFDHGSKSVISHGLVALGAIIQDSVTRSTDYLIVGGRGNSAWSAGNYGTKVKKALEMQGMGMRIVILSETDFYKAMGE